jgi:hypothetical protein
MPPRSIEDCITREGTLSRLALHASRLLRLQRLLESYLPPALARGARVANIKPGKVVIHADTGAVAAKLRQITPTILGVFRNEAAEVTGIEIKVQPRLPRPAGPDKPDRPPPGATARRDLTALADRLPAASPLRKALQRLVDRS